MSFRPPQKPPVVVWRLPGVLCMLVWHAGWDRSRTIFANNLWDCNLHHLILSHPLEPGFCTCHDSRAAVTCAKFLLKLTIIFHVIAKCNYNIFLTWDHELYVKWVHRSRTGHCRKYGLGLFEICLILSIIKSVILNKNGNLQHGVQKVYIIRLVQERHNSIANALELHLSCTRK